MSRESSDVSPLCVPVPPAVFSQVSSPSLGVYHMQMGPVALEVSSGDITKEASDAIVNSSNENFNLKSGLLTVQNLADHQSQCLNVLHP